MKQMLRTITVQRKIVLQNCDNYLEDQYKKSKNKKPNGAWASATTLTCDLEFALEGKQGQHILLFIEKMKASHARQLPRQPLLTELQDMHEPFTK